MSTQSNHINGQQRFIVVRNPSKGNGLAFHRGNNQLDNDFMNQREINTTNHADMSSSAQLTSKTALLVRQRRAMLEQLSCFICQGYLIDATTIDECMDSFCKSCIVIYLKSHNNCPKCGALIPRPFEDAIRSDKILQDIVYKLIPGLYDNEMKRRRNFYREHLSGVTNVPSDDEEETSSLEGNGSISPDEKFGILKRPKPFYKPTDTIDLSIEPQTRGEEAKIYYDNKRQSIVTCFTGRLQQRDMNIGPIFTSVDSQLFKTYLRCPGKFTVAQLKKFIAAKFNVCRDDTIQLFYLNESLKDGYSLIDIAYIYDWRGIEHMQLFYIIERDLSKANVSDDVGSRVGGHSRAVARQTSSVGTQATKRVCIDPEPRYCEERDSTKPEATTNMRSMRSRDTAIKLGNLSKIVTRNVTTSSIIKPSSTPINLDERAPIVHSNDIQVSRVQASNTNSNSEMKIDKSRSLRSQQPVVRVNLKLPSKTNVIFSNSTIGNNDRKNTVVATKPQQASQFVPVSTKSVSYMSGTTAAPCSLVTLASFTEARTNHVMATVTATTSSQATAASASTICYSNKNSTDNRHSANQKFLPVATTTTAKSFVAASNAHSESKAGNPASTPAYSYVTERGITIVQRMNSGGNQSSSIGQLQALPTAPQAQQQASNQSQPTHNQRSSISPISNPARHIVVSAPSSSPAPSPISQQAVVNNRNGEGSDGVTPRHQIKVKPVYKTFVDPTKLKSPNLKKLGLTARH